MRNLTVMRFRLCELPTPAVLRINDGEGKRQDEGAAVGDCEDVAAVGKGQGQGKDAAGAEEEAPLLGAANPGACEYC